MTVLSQSQRLYLAMQQIVFIHRLSSFVIFGHLQTGCIAAMPHV